MPHHTKAKQQPGAPAARASPARPHRAPLVTPANPPVRLPRLLPTRPEEGSWGAQQQRRGGNVALGAGASRCPRRPCTAPESVSQSPQPSGLVARLISPLWKPAVCRRSDPSCLFLERPHRLNANRNEHDETRQLASWPLLSHLPCRPHRSTGRWLRTGLPRVTEGRRRGLAGAVKWAARPWANLQLGTEPASVSYNCTVMTLSCTESGDESYEHKLVKQRMRVLHFSSFARYSKERDRRRARSSRRGI